MFDHEIGGGYVRRVITRGAEPALQAGSRMTREQILAMPVANRRAMIASGQIAVYPRAPDGETARAERHIVHNGGGRYDVIAGQKLNSGPLTKDEAEELATRPN